MKTQFFLDKPEQVKISITNICNYRCVMCYNPKMRQKRGFMSDELFFKIADECKREGIERLSVGSSGEALLHRNYIEYLRYAKKLGLKASTTSNCSRLSPETTDIILKEGLLDRFNISIYSVNAEQHYEYTSYNDFDKVHENITYFLNEWHKTKSKCQVNMWFLEIPGVNEYEEYMKFWGPLADKVGLSLPQKEAINWSERVDECSTYVKEPKFWFERGSRRIAFCRRKKIRCESVRTYLYILHNGDVLPCCNILEPGDNKEILFDNAESNSVMDIWESARYQQFKKQHDQMKLDAYPLCKVCSEVVATKRLHFPPMVFGSDAK